MKRFTRLALGALLAAGVAVGTALAAGRTSTTGTTMHLIEHHTSFNFLPLAGPRKGRTAKPGDAAVFAGNLLDAHKRPNGRVQVNCFVTSGGTNPTLQCYGTFSLTGGTMIGSGLIHANSNAPDHIAILGGTGAYEGARGSILSAPNKTNQNISYDTIHLLP